MSLTAEDLNNIKHLFDDRFDKIDGRLSDIDSRFDRVDQDIENLATATQQQFEVVINRLDQVQDDVAVIKDIVKDHSFRITRLEHHIAPSQ